MIYEPTTWVNGDVITATKMNNIESGVQSVSSSYTPTTWVNGDIITAQKMNNIEQGIANAGGGGGSSDFSTAMVTINNESGITIPVIYIQSVIEENALGAGSPVGVINAAYNIGSTASIRVPLYKGGALWAIGDELIDYEISVSGSATKVTSAIYYITGDCTITIS